MAKDNYVGDNRSDIRIIRVRARDKLEEIDGRIPSHLLVLVCVHMYLDFFLHKIPLYMSLLFNIMETSKVGII